jgi:hypothetical protein
MCCTAGEEGLKVGWHGALFEEWCEVEGMSGGGVKWLDKGVDWSTRIRLDTDFLASSLGARD